MGEPEFEKDTDAVKFFLVMTWNTPSNSDKVCENARDRMYEKDDEGELKPKPFDVCHFGCYLDETDDSTVVVQTVCSHSYEIKMNMYESTGGHAMLKELYTGCEADDEQAEEGQDQTILIV